MKRKNRLLSKLHPGVAESCVICGIIKIPKQTSKGWETPSQLMKRKTCGKGTDCYREFITGKRNPNYKGYLPTCLICKKKLSYNSAEDNKKGILPQFCGKHWLEKMKKDKKGIYPRHLMPYGWKKGESHLNLHKNNCQCFVHTRNYISKS